MRKKPASGVLAALRGSLYGREPEFVSSLAAALLDGIFTHSAGVFGTVSHRTGCDGYRQQNEFFRSLLEDG